MRARLLLLVCVLCLSAPSAFAATHGAALGRFFSYGFILQVVAIVHFIRRRPDSYWIWIIIFFGAIGATVYIVMEMVPDLGLARQSMKGFSRRKRVKMLEAIVLENPSAGNYEELGDLPLEEKRYPRARECFDRALSSRTDSVDPFYRRGIATFELGDYAAALSDFERVVKIDPKYDFSRARVFYARSLAKTGRTEEASATFEKLIDISTSTETLCAAAEFFAEQKQTAKAKELVERILARRVTMPAYQKRRERPWLRRASALARRLNAAAAWSTAIRADISIPSQIEPKRPVGGVSGAIHPDATAHGNCRLVDFHFARGDEQTVAIERLAVEAPVDVHCGTDFSRPIHQIEIAFRLRAPLAHRFRSTQRFRSANEHRLGDVRLLRDDVQAPVHAVREVDIGVTTLEIHRLVTERAQTAPRMARLVVRAQICFGFHESRSEKLTAAAVP